jgi:hypothetical protein
MATDRRKKLACTVFGLSPGDEAACWAAVGQRGDAVFDSGTSDYQAKSRGISGVNLGEPEAWIPGCGSERELYPILRPIVEAVCANARPVPEKVGRRPQKDELATLVFSDGTRCQEHFVIPPFHHETAETYITAFVAVKKLQDAGTTRRTAA